MKFKTLNMNNHIDKKILLTYFFKKINTVINKEELLAMSCIYYNSKENKILSCTRRFSQELEGFQNIKININNVDSTLQNILSSSLKVQEELVRCDFQRDDSIDHFYIAVIGVDFFLVESEIRNS